MPQLPKPRMDFLFDDDAYTRDDDRRRVDVDDDDDARDRRWDAGPTAVGGRW